MNRSEFEKMMIENADKVCVSINIAGGYWTGVYTAVDRRFHINCFASMKRAMRFAESVSLPAPIVVKV